MEKAEDNPSRAEQSGTVEEANKTPTVVPWWKQPRMVLLAIAGAVTIFTLITEWTHLGLSENMAKTLYGIVAIIGGIYPAKTGFAALSHGRLTINTLLIAGAIGAIYLDFGKKQQDL